MVLSILKGVQSEWMVIIIAVIFLVAFILFNLLEKKLSKRLYTKIEERDSLFIELDKLGLSLEPPEMLIVTLDSLARRFFERDFGISRNINYSELSEVFAKSGKKELSEFSDKMTGLLYAGQPVTKNMIVDLLYQLESAMNLERAERKTLAQQMQTSG